jgi:hypothetical protein
LKHVVLEAFLQFGHPKGFCKILKKNLDEDSATRGGLVLIQVDNGHDMPSNGIGTEEMAEEACYVSKTIRFISMDGLVVLCE